MHGLLICIGFVVLSGSCKKLEPGVVENTYSGSVGVTSSGQDPAGDFEGSGDSGTYSFAFDNPKTKVDARFDITTPTGSVRMVIEDKKGKIFLNTNVDEIIQNGDEFELHLTVAPEGKSSTP
ncbi:MAG: hypothetical protein IH949_13240, partial [Bacteroidetes bacterium]|nr:hypothetical protein [Bacteroidota bacterium]